MSKVTIEHIEGFCERLKQHAIRKAELYDGVNKDMPVDTALRYATEELGEIATAITRQRLLQAEAECIDLAHTAMLVSFALEKKL